jgi:hypothetical protein
VISKAAAEAYADLAPTMKDWRAEGMTLDGIAGRLNAEGHTTRRGKSWNPVQVARVLSRAEAARVMSVLFPESEGKPISWG